MKVYNIGIRPIVYDRKRGVRVIHPRKFVELPEKKAEWVISTFENACSETDYEKSLANEKKKAASASVKSNKSTEEKESESDK